MPKYRVVVYVGDYHSLHIEAEDATTAAEEAWERAHEEYFPQEVEVVEVYGDEDEDSE
jgi:hypothetical protein